METTIEDYFSYCREVRQWLVETKLLTDQPIGGPGLTVEIDELKLGKTKYHRGRFVEGQWNNKRDRATLEPIILQHIKLGTTVMSDCWKAYDSLGAFSFQHLTVNHSYNFVDPLTGAYTNNMENL
uniref:ISXO2-like transposase domain-containing protein n=1 Tax=Octopus bimaculoides TaxID=37653 RepID=A0A0L8G1M4_OCTBM